MTSSVVLRTVGVTLVCMAVLMATTWTFAEEPPSPAPIETPAAAAVTPAPAPPPKIDSGDTAWLLISSALVLAMTAPGLAIFYAGMVRKKNALNTIMQCFIILCLISIQWVLWGYSLAFGPPSVYGLSVDVRRHHTGAYHGGLRRTDEVYGVLGLRASLGHIYLRSACALGVGRRGVDAGLRRVRLRGRNSRPH